MMRIALFLAIAAVAVSAKSVQNPDPKAYGVGKRFLTTLLDLTADSQFSEVQRKLKTDENSEMRNALSNAFVKSANGESQLNMREVVRAFEEISQKNKVSPDDVLKAISNDPSYNQLAKLLETANLYTEEEKVQAVPSAAKSLFSS